MNGLLKKRLYKSTDRERYFIIRNKKNHYIYIVKYTYSGNYRVEVMKGNNLFLVSIIIVALTISNYYSKAAVYREDTSRGDFNDINNIIPQGSTYIYAKDNIFVEAAGLSAYHGMNCKQFTIIDYNNIANPKEIGGYYLNSSGETFHGFYLNDSLLYLYLDTGILQNSLGFEIVDISNETNPVFKGNFTVNDSYIWWRDPRWLGTDKLQFKDNCVLLHAGPSNDANRWIRFIDCTNLSSPEEIGKFESSHGNIESFTLLEEVMYASTFFGYLDIVNITDKTSPSLISSIYLGGGDCYNRIELNNNYLFIYAGYELPSMIYDVSNCTNPQFISDFSSTFENDFSDLVFKENLLFGIQNNYICLYDITDINEITLINEYNFTEQFSNYGEIYGHFFWGQIDNNRLYLSRVSDNELLTVFIVDFTDIHNFSIYSRYDLSTLTPNSASVGFIATNAIISNCLVFLVLINKSVKEKRKKNKQS